jgi:hypothetical protein
MLLKGIKEISRTSKEALGIIAFACIIIVYCFIQYPTLFNGANENYDGWRQTDTYTLRSIFISSI